MIEREKNSLLSDIANLFVEGGPFPDVTFSLASKFLNTNFTGALVLYYHELKDRHKLRVQNGVHF
jgi:hypothetical protein